MTALWVLLAGLSVWASPEQAKPWVSLEPSHNLTQNKDQADIKIEESLTPLPGVVSFAPLEESEDKGVSLRYVGPPNNTLSQLDWNGAPQPARWQKLTPTNEEQALVETADGDPFILLGPHSLRLALVLCDENRQFLAWPALPYVVYAAIEMVGGKSPTPFATWSRSPLPTGDVRAPIYAALLLLAFASLALFVLAWRAGRRASYKDEQLRALSGQAVGRNEAWSKVSFRRPLAGFIFFLIVQMLLLISLGYLTQITFSNKIQPFPWVDGTMGWVTTTFEVAWYLFDSGTRDAFIRFFAERRHADPRGALRCAQFFVWWQLLTGLLQITLITFLALEFMPGSSYALFAWPLLLQAAGQWPGVQNIFSAYFQGAQRFDYAQTLDLIVGTVLNLALPIGLVLYFRSWGAAHPAYGEAMGALIGLAVSSYLVQLGSMLIGAILAKRAGLLVRELFYADFDRKTAKEMLSYGLLLTIGQLPNRLSFAVNNFILKARILNYSELMGVYGKADGSFLMYFKWSLSFYKSGVPGLAEAFAAKKLALARCYIARFWQYGSLFSALVAALVLGTGATFVHYALDPQWARISDYLFFLTCIGLLLGPSWLSDTLQQGADRPGLFGALVAGEQLARIALFLVFVQSMQFKGYLLAIFLPLLTKTIVAWTINVKKILRPQLHWWVHLAGPALVGLMLWLVFFVLSHFVSSSFGASVLLFGGGLGALLGGFFLAGLVGLFDQAALSELRDASQMTGRVLAPMVAALPYVATLGYRLSPVKERFLLPGLAEAEAEAREIEAGLAAHQNSAST